MSIVTEAAPTVHTTIQIAFELVIEVDGIVHTYSVRPRNGSPMWSLWETDIVTENTVTVLLLGDYTSREAAFDAAAHLAGKHQG